MQPVNPPSAIRFGAFEVDLRSSELRKHGVRIKLQEQPFHILAFLLQHPGELVTRDELRHLLWPDDTFVDFDHSLNTAVMRLREALGDSSENPRFIETLPRKGYRFIAPAEELAAVSHTKRHSDGLSGETSESSSTKAAEVSPKAHDSQTGIAFSSWKWMNSPYLRRLLPLGGSLSVALVIVVGFVVHYLRRPVPSSAATHAIKSIVVLPLENLSGDKEQDYFADGMTDELIANLAKIRSLRVISRTSAMEYKGVHKSLSEIARSLNVDAVVEGTVLRVGSRVRITAELVQVETDRHLWADTYESTVGDVLTLQSQVASAIVNEIRISLTPEEQQRLAITRPVSEESYEDYLKGRYYYSNNRSGEGLGKAIEYFQRATEKDPKYALAYAGLANCYGIMGSAVVGTMSAAEAAPKARAAALKALELDNTLAEAETSLATIQFNYDWDWADAAKGFQRAIELNPSYATAYQRYSLYLMAMGRMPESLEQINRARELEPLSISMNFSLGWRLYMARQYDQAIEQLRNTLEMDTNFAVAHLVLGQAYEQKGMYDLALAELQKAVTVSNRAPLMLAGLGHAYAVSGRKADAEKVLAQLSEQSKKRYVSPFFFTLIYKGLGERDRAMEWMDKAYQDRSNGLVFMKVDPELDPLRDDSRFKDLQRRMHLSD